MKNQTEIPFGTVRYEIMTWQDSYGPKLWNYTIRKSVRVRFKRSKRCGWRGQGFAAKHDSRKFASHDEAIAAAKAEKAQLKS